MVEVPLSQERLRAFVEAQALDSFCPAVPRVRRRRLVTALTADARSGAPVTLCAPAGSGVTSLLSDLAATWADDRGDVRQISLRSVMPAEASDALEIARTALASWGGRDSLLIVDDVPALDEFEAQDCAAALQLLVRKACVVCGTCPGGELLVEALGDHPTWDAATLAVRYDEVANWRASDQGSSRALQRLTGGIVALAEASWQDVRAGSDEQGPRYSARRGQLVLDAVRGALVQEERRLRGAMALWGSGSVADLRGLGARCSQELLESTRREAPVLGVRQGEAAFCLVGGPECPEEVADFCASAWPDLGCAATARLLEEGRADRALVIARGCHEPAALAEALDGHWVELWDAGGRELVERLADESGDGPPGAARRLLSGGSGAGEAPDASLCWAPVLALRSLGRGAAVVATPPAGDGLVTNRCAATLWALWESRRALVAGDYAAALMAAVRGAAAAPEGSVAGAMLAQDRALASAVLGQAGASEEQAAAELEALRVSGGEALWLRETARFQLARLVSGSASEGAPLDEALAATVRTHDGLGRGMVLVTQAIQALGAGDAAEARSRGVEAARVGGACSCRPLQEGGATVAVLADALVGTAARPPENIMAPDLKLLAQCAAHAAGGGSGSWEPPNDVPISAFGLAVLRAALSRSGVPQDRLWGALPSSWRASYGARRKTSPAPLQLPMPIDAGDGGSSMELSLLGGFSVRVDGRPVEPREFRRFSSRAVVALLGVRNGHKASRSELAAELWPGRSVQVGRRNLYSAISCARKAMGDREYGSRHLLVTRELVALNPETVTCDLDGFEALLERVVSGDGGHRERVALAEQAMGAYNGGSYVPEQGVPSGLGAYHDWLESRYVEALAVAAQSALKLGRLRQARRFATEACELAPLLEDATRALMEALMREGRPLEARRAFRAFRTAAGHAGLPVPEALEACYRALDEAPPATTEQVA